MFNVFQKYHRAVANFGVTTLPPETRVILFSKRAIRIRRNID